jgi:hypothetical protein
VLRERDWAIAGAGHLHAVLAALLLLPTVPLEQRDRGSLIERRTGHARTVRRAAGPATSIGQTDTELVQGREEL